MSGQHPRFVLILPATLLCLALMNPAYAAQRHSAGKPPVKPEQPAPTPQPVPPPLTLEQMPSSPPQVSFRNGQLTIVAQNSTLGDILRGVRKQTGAVVEIPSNATERVVGQFGPGRARDVLASLLNGSHFNYVMLGSATNPDLMERVILISKSGGTPQSGPADQTNAVNQPGYTQPPVQLRGSIPTSQETEEMTSDEAPEDTGETDQPDNQANQSEQQQQQPNGQPAIKTPEQLLQELQRQQQQLQQQQTAPQGFPIPPNQAPQPQPNQPPPPQ